MIIGRTAEVETLENLLKSKKSEFLAIYGRRRVGKTYLIREFFSEKKCIFFSATGSKKGNMAEQIDHFTKRISEVFLEGIMPAKSNSWDKTFELLTKVINKIPKDTKVVIFLDELPWLATKRSRLLQMLDYYWNQYWSVDHRLKLIVCGSSASWIINKIINNKGGLHNRITKKILLRPFSLYDTKKFLQANKIKLNNWHITQIYMLTGGIPFYLSYIEQGQSSAQVIENLAFADNAPLLKEFDNLFSSLFDNAGPYIEIIRLIANNRYGTAQADLIKQSSSFSKGGFLVDKLQELIDAGFIMSFKPYKNKNKGIYYKVIDEYTLFYLHWIEPIKESLSSGGLAKGYWQELQGRSTWHSWAGLAFEAIVYKHLLQVRTKLTIPPSALAHSWRYIGTSKTNLNGAQIDLLFDRYDSVITLCEIKFSEQIFLIDKQYAKNLVNKKEVFTKITKTKKQIFMAMITASGIKDNIYSDDLVTGVVSLDDLFLS